MMALEWKELNNAVSSSVYVEDQTGEIIGNVTENYGIGTWHGQTVDGRGSNFITAMPQYQEHGRGK